MRKLILIVFLFAVAFFSAKIIFAQETSSQSASPVNLTFPIAELGNCSSAADCKAYCDDPTHLDACIAYAKEKGFYKESTLDNSQEAILEAAKTTLGCDSLDSCRTFCQNSANADACTTFAQEHHLTGGTKQIDNTTLTKAEKILGCTSADTCKTFCQQTENQEKCIAFAKENGLKGGNQTVGPGGCTSEDSCKTYCSSPDNFQTCSQFVQEHTASGSGQRSFTGPGGCSSEEACRSYCEQNPTSCRMNPGLMIASSSAKNGLPSQAMHGDVRIPNMHGPSGQPDVNAGSSGSIEVRNGEFGPHPSGTQLPPTGQIVPSQNPEGAFPPVTGEVKAAETHKDIFTWLFDALFH